MADYSDIPQKSQPLLQLEEIFNKQYISNENQKAVYREILEQVKKKFPKWSAMAQHLHASGLVQQEQTGNYQNYRQSELGKRMY